MRAKIRVWGLKVEFSHPKQTPGCSSGVPALMGVRNQHQGPQPPGVSPKHFWRVSHPSVLPRWVWITLGEVGKSQKFFLCLDLLW